MDFSKILSDREFIERLINNRRELHKIPERGLELPKTRAFVIKELERLNVPYQKNEGDSGIIVDINGYAKGKTLCLRGDMDGLHVNEACAVDYKSQIEGQMHACGHDCHTAILLAVLEILIKNTHLFKGRVRLLFQAGEETGNGAKQMISKGAIANADAIASIHVGSLAGDNHKPGSLAIMEGAVSAGKNKFKITIKGKGCHSAFPEDAIDPIKIASKIVMQVDALSSEIPKGEKVAIAFGSLNAGVDHNTIPDTAELKGGIRCQNDELREYFTKRVLEIAENCAREYGGSVEIDLIRSSVTIYNDSELARRFASATKMALGEENVITSVPQKLMASDDFCNYLKEIPGVYFMLNTNNPEKGIVYANHNPHFNVDEETLINGVVAYLAIALEYLN